MIRIYLWSCIGLTGLAMLVGYGLVGWWMIGVGAVLLAGLWWILEFRRIVRIVSIFFLVYSVMAALGIMLGVSIFWMLSAEIFLLSAWDLARFTHRVEKSSTEGDHTGIERDHIKKLATVNGIGFLAAITSTSLRYQLPFFVYFFIGLLTLILLTWAVSSLKEMR